MYPVHIYFTELPFHVQSVPLAFLIEYDSSFSSASLTVLVASLQKPLPFLLSPKCTNLPLRWMDQNCYTYAHLDLHPSSEAQELFYPDKISGFLGGSISYWYSISHNVIYNAYKVISNV